MKEKWEFDLGKLKGYCIGEDKIIYKRPYESYGRTFPYRPIKMQYSNRWRLAGEWWSKNQLRKHIVPAKGEEITKINDLPF